MSFELPLTIDLFFGDSGSDVVLVKSADKNSPQWMLQVRLLSESFILRPLPWNDGDKSVYNAICRSNETFLKSILSFMSAMPNLKQLPIIELGTGDGLVSMFLKRRGFKGVVTSDFENVDSMYIIKWNNEENTVPHKHIPFNWGQKFPKQELINYWRELVDITLPEPDDYPPFIDMYHQACIIIANDVLISKQYFVVLHDTIKQLFDAIYNDLASYPILLLGLNRRQNSDDVRFFNLLRRDNLRVDPIGKDPDVFVIRKI